MTTQQSPCCSSPAACTVELPLPPLQERRRRRRRHGIPCGALPLPSAIRIRNKLVRMLLLSVLCLLASIPNASFSGYWRPGGFAIIIASAQEVRIRPDNGDDGMKRQSGGDPPVNLRGKEAMNVALKNNTTQPESFSDIVYKAGKRGIGGGLPGAAAGVVQVLTLMWIRTIINYQYRYGTTFLQAVQTLRSQGGIRRFYRGVGFALVQNPLSKFVSTAANDGMRAFLANFEVTRGWGPGRTTFVASIVVGLWRMALMPIDTCKTVLQVDSTEGFRNLIRKVRAGKVGVLYQGAIANAFSSILSNYPWFYVYNRLSVSEWVTNAFGTWPLLRNAWIGFVASVVSDVLTNFVRVIKTTKQAIATKHAVGYRDAISMILAADGWKGLFGRGLKTRVLANAIQSVVFTVVWRGLVEWRGKNREEEDNSETDS